MEFIITRMNNDSELYHYGVKGMKWGHRKKYVTVANGMSNARKAGQDAWRKSHTESGSKLIGKRQTVAISKPSAKRTARKAYKDAVNASLEKDKAYNKNLRAEKRSSKLSEKQKKAIKIGVGVGVAAAATYGVYKVNKFIKGKNAEIHINEGRKAVSKLVNDFGGLDTDTFNRAYSMAISNAKEAASGDTLGMAIRNVANYYVNGR